MGGTLRHQGQMVLKGETDLHKTNVMKLILRTRLKGNCMCGWVGLCMKEASENVCA